MDRQFVSSRNALLLAIARWAIHFRCSRKAFAVEVMLDKIMGVIFYVCAFSGIILASVGIYQEYLVSPLPVLRVLCVGFGILALVLLLKQTEQ